jgi:hypothetical protein
MWNTIVGAIYVVGFGLAVNLRKDSLGAFDQFEIIGVVALFLSLNAIVTFMLEWSMRNTFVAEYMLYGDGLVLKRLEEQHSSLLHAMLPDAVIKDLKNGKKTVSETFEEVTVLFCEICNFHHIATNYPPDRVIAALNLIYSKFDTLIDKYKVHKVGGLLRGAATTRFVCVHVCARVYVCICV